MLFLALATAVLSIQVADLVSIGQLVREAEQFQSAGAATYTLVAPQAIDGVACEQLNAIAGVRAAGAIRVSESDLRLGALPDTPVPLSEVTITFPGVVRATVQPFAGIVISTQVADLLRTEVGSEVDALAGTTRVRGVYDYPDDGRRAGLGFAALVPAPSEGPFDECWMDAWPQNPELQSALLSALLPSASADDARPELAQLNSSLGTDFVGQDRFDGRVTQLGYPLAVVLAIAIGIAAVRLRRLELAAALHSRVRRRHLIAILVLEALSWVAPVILIGFSSACWFAVVGAEEDRVGTLLQGLKLPLLAAAAAVLGVVAASAFVRERHLFRYFKER